MTACFELHCIQKKLLVAGPVGAAEKLGGDLWRCVIGKESFDLSWKVMKDILVQYYAITGFVAGSPREVRREAYTANLISNDAWMQMLKLRNELAHDYDCEIVKEHCHTIVETYINLLYKFEDTVKGLDLNREET